MRQHDSGNIAIVLIAIGHIAVVERIRVNPRFPAGAFQSLPAADGRQMIRRQMQAQRTAVARGQQGLHRRILTLFVVRDIAGHRIVQAFAVGQHAGEG